MKLLITGANGQLGWELCRQKEQYGFDSHSCDLPIFDITDRDNVIETIEKVKPDMIINAAAYTAVDQAEKDPKTAFLVNGDGPMYLAEACSRIQIPLIHVSTDYVFDGTKTRFYSENDPVSPIGVYGKSKAMGEENIRGILNNHIIIRTSWLYGVHGNNFVKTMLRLGKTNKQIRVVDDQYGCPTFAADLGETILKISSAISKKKPVVWGTYHYSNTGCTTWYQFAKKIFELAFEYDTFLLDDLIPITTAEYPTSAERPNYSVLDCNRIADTFGFQLKSWESSLYKMLKTFYRKQQDE